ncbi:MAG: NAD-dependent epimerase/dehydratase family protein [Nitrososphaerales archaeon]
MATRILVTGGAGFLGNHLVSRLINEKLQVVVLDNFSSESGSRVTPATKTIRGDIREKETVRGAVSQADQIVHLAAIVSITESIKNPQSTIAVNVDGTRNMLEEAKSAGVKKFVFASSCSVYGEAKYLPMDEKHPCMPISPYASSKLAAEGLCKDFSSKKGLDVSILRFFNIYGPGQKAGPYAGVISNFFDNLKRSRPLQIFGNGDQVRDFIFVEDVVEAIVRCIKSPGTSSNILNVGSGAALSINQLARECQEVVGRDVSVNHLEARSGDIERSCADITLMRQDLSFHPRFAIKEGLEKTLKGNAS